MTPLMTKFDMATGTAAFDDKSTLVFPAGTTFVEGHTEDTRTAWQATSKVNPTVKITLILGATKTHIEAAIRRCELGV